MIRKLFTSQIKDMLNLPESGMGYQLIQADHGFSQTSKFIVLNSQIIIDDTSSILLEMKDVQRRGFKNALFSASELELRNIRLVESLSNSAIKSFSASQTSTGAKHQPKIKANGSEVFTRLSAYEDDRRIDQFNKRLLPGSYTTTLADYQFCKKNSLDPVDRYALPNDEPIKWAFHIRPTTSDTLQRGIVEPANGHRGGGVEAYFENGTSNNTFLEKTAY